MTKTVQGLLRRIWSSTLTKVRSTAVVIASLWGDLLTEGIQGFAWITNLHIGQKSGIPGLFTWLWDLEMFTGSRRWHRFPWSGLGGISTRETIQTY